MAGDLDRLDLDWLAVRHLLGELDDAEMSRFAELLGEDDAAVAALRRAARLLAAIERAGPAATIAAATGTVCPPARGSRGSVGGGRMPGRRGWWLVIGAAGVAAAAAGVMVVSGSASRSPGRPAELLSLWQKNADRSDPESDERGWDSDGLGDADIADAAGADAPPDWLLTAVTLAEVRRPPLVSPDDQRGPRGRN